MAEGGTGIHSDLVLVSPAARTRETWDAARPSFPAARVQPCERLYLAAPEVIRDVVGSRSLGQGRHDHD